MMQRVPLGYFSLESFICCAKNGTRLIKSDRQLESEQQKNNVIQHWRIVQSKHRIWIFLITNWFYSVNWDIINNTSCYIITSHIIIYHLSDFKYQRHININKFTHQFIFNMWPNHPNIKYNVAASSHDFLSCQALATDVYVLGSGFSCKSLSKLQNDGASFKKAMAERNQDTSYHSNIPMSSIDGSVWCMAMIWCVFFNALNSLNMCVVLYHFHQGVFYTSNLILTLWIVFVRSRVHSGLLLAPSMLFQLQGHCGCYLKTWIWVIPQMTTVTLQLLQRYYRRQVMKPETWLTEVSVF